MTLAPAARKPHPIIARSSDPLTDLDRISWLQLIRCRRVGPTTFHRLLGEHGSADAALADLPHVARDAGVKDYEVWSRDAAIREYTDGQARGYRLICKADPEYPDLLAEMDDAPPVLWAAGDLALLKRRKVSLVGARNASSLGLRMARSIAADLGKEDIVVTSGLARGIDAAAHAAALPHGTIAVMAGGLDVVYPRENQALFDRIRQDGLCLSEEPFGVAPQARHFPKRNRIVAGLSLATVVIEGAARSGSLITARNAGDLGREVMAVPGNPLDGRAAGCNMLIRDGAALVRSAKDILEGLTPQEATPAPQPELSLEPPKPKPAPRPKPEVSALILEKLGVNAVAEDALLRDTGLSAAAASQHLLSLELEGKISRQPGGMIARTTH